MDQTKIALFNGVTIRRVFLQNEWWFVIHDVIAALTDSANPSDYFKKMRRRDQELALLVAKGGDKLSPPSN
jgi:DNA-damage-inducible protein D